MPVWRRPRWRVPSGAIWRKEKIFTGTKWAAHPTARSVDLFLERTCAAFGGLPAGRFDPVTVTRYAGASIRRTP